MAVKTFHLDPKKFPQVRLNIILTYTVLAMAALGIFYFYLRGALFAQAWILIPAILVLFAAAGWYAVRQRRKYWDEFKLRITDRSLIRSVPNMPDMQVRFSDITGYREVSQGLILSTSVSENALLIPKALGDQNYQAVKAEISRQTKQRG